MASRPGSKLTPRTSVADAVYERLKKMIVEGELAPALSVSETQLAALVGSGRTPLREALKRLEAERLVERMPNGRLTIPTLSAEEARELFAVRSALESLVVEEACRRMTDEWAARLREMERSVEVLAGAGLIAEALRRSDAFHFALVDLAGNSVAKWALDALRGRLQRYRAVAPAHSPEVVLTAAREHLALVELMIAGRAEEASRLMRQHVEIAMRETVPLLKELAPTVEQPALPRQRPALPDIEFRQFADSVP